MPPIPSEKTLAQILNITFSKIYITLSRKGRGREETMRDEDSIKLMIVLVVGVKIPLLWVCRVTKLIFYFLHMHKDVHKFLFEYN